LPENWNSRILGVPKIVLTVVISEDYKVQGFLNDTSFFSLKTLNRPARAFCRRLFMTPKRIWVALCLFLFVFIGFGHAQNTNATVSGLITDSSGGAVPGATIEITNTGTGVSSTAQSNGDGLYRIAGLVPGLYRAQVSMAGFKNVVKDQIDLHVGDQVALDFALQVGDVSQSVTVTAGEPLLQTQSTSLSQVIGGRTVQDTPLNGRNVLNLVTLVPGVISQGGTQGNPLNNTPNGWGNYQIGGGMANQSSTYLDGAPLNVSYVNSLSLIPTQEAIQEFQVATNAVTPEYGRFAGGVINLSTKSGTNEIHGTAYEYIRNRVLNANNFFNNRTDQPTPAFTQNQYGVTVGGPLKKDKLFGFFSWEGFSLRTGDPELLTVPTDAMRAGDFSGVGENIYDPYTSQGAANTRSQFEGCNGNQPNVICASRIDPTAKVLQTFFPEPNVPNTTVNNYEAVPKIGGNYNQYLGRLDWAFSDRQRLFTRYTFWDISKVQANPFNNSTGRPHGYFRTQQFVVGDDIALNNTTAASIRLSYLRFIDNAISLSTGVDLATFGPNYAALADQILAHQNPVANISGVVGADYQNQDTFVYNTDNIFTLSTSITKTIGKHSVTFGGEVRKIQWYYTQNNDGGGYFNFDHNFTAQTPFNSTNGYAYASFLLGTSSGGFLDNVIRPDALQWYGGVYVTDTFQMTPRLTINAGIRWEQPGSFSEKNNSLTVLDPTAPDPLSASTGLNLVGQVALTGSSLYPHSTQQALHWDLFSPRVGFSYRLYDNTVVRGGYGISYLPNDVGFGAAPFQSPVNTAQTNMPYSLNGGITPYATLSNPFPNGLTQPIGHDQSRMVELEGESPASPVAANSYPYAQQWNFNVEQQLGGKTVLQIGYGGAKGTHLPLYQQNLDQIPNQYDALGSALLNPVSNPFYGKLPTTSGILGSSTTIAQGYLLKPYPQFLSFTQSSPFVGASTYNSLQVLLKRSLGPGGTVLGSYTWSKLMNNTDTLTAWLESSAPPTGLQNAYDLQAERSISANDAPQNFVLSYIFDMPVGRGKYWLGNLNGIPQALLGGWSANGVSTFRSGFPLSFTAQPTVLSTDFGAGTPRPNVVAGCSKQVSGSAQGRLEDWFNTSCFTAPNPYGFGDESRNDALLRGAGIANWDFGLFKTIPINERFNAQFRGEVFNLANRVQFSPPGATLGTGQFGVVTAQYNTPRVFQFSLRLNY
jgi:Carboxypeptidase regulatory-like domain/TonB-dependent Receptor Plug Domain